MGLYRAGPVLLEVGRKINDTGQDQIDRHHIIEQARHEQNRIPAIKAINGLIRTRSMVIVFFPVRGAGRPDSSG